MRPVPDAVLPLIHQFEQGPDGGFAPEVYYDPANVPTIGWGHAIFDANDPLMDATITAQQADDMAKADLEGAASSLCTSLGGVIDSLNDNQYAALIDFVFNEGIGHFNASTMCHLLQTNQPGVADQFQRWVYGGKPPRILSGLVNRRNAERLLFLS